MATNQATLQKERANNQGKTEVTRKLHRNKERTIWMIVAFMVWNITKEKGKKKGSQEQPPKQQQSTTCRIDWVLFYSCWLHFVSEDWNDVRHLTLTWHVRWKCKIPYDSTRKQYKNIDDVWVDEDEKMLNCSNVIICNFELSVRVLLLLF